MKKETTNNEHGLIPFESINQAQLLLEYAVQKGLSIDKQITADIVNAKHLADPDKWTSDVETSFWQAYDALADKIKPVSVQSLKALHKVHEGGFPFLQKYFKRPRTSDADRIVSYYRKITDAFIILLLYVQVLYSYGAAVVMELNKLPDNIAQVEEERQKIIFAPETPQKTEKARKQEEANLGELSAKKDALQTKYQASFKVLEKWMNMVRLGINPAEDELKNKKPVDKLGQETMGKIIMQQDANFILQVMQSYLLPLLYGFAGACAYILRSLSNEIKNVTYIRASRVVYLTRLLLGGLSGLAIGWFVSPSTSSALKTVSPFAVAFVAGYGVELLFSIMDKIIAALSTESVQKPQGQKT